jgi:isoleucyl-tRNA synthetase
LLFFGVKNSEEMGKPTPHRNNNNKPEEKLVAWTTTPWTVLSNLALAVNPDIVLPHCS